MGHWSVLCVHPCTFLGASHVHRGVPACEKRAEHPWGVTQNAVCWGVFYMSWAENFVALESILEGGGMSGMFVIVPTGNGCFSTLRVCGITPTSPVHPWSCL